MEIYLKSEGAWQEFKNRVQEMHFPIIIGENELTDTRVYLDVDIEYQDCFPAVYVYKGCELVFEGTYLDEENFEDDLVYLYDNYLENPSWEDEVEAEYQDYLKAYEPDLYEEMYGYSGFPTVDDLRESFDEYDDDEEYEDDEETEDFEETDSYIYCWDLLNILTPDFSSLADDEQEKLVDIMLMNAETILIEEGFSLNVK